MRKLVISEPTLRTTLFLFIGGADEVRAYLKKQWNKLVEADDDLSDCIMNDAAGTSFAIVPDNDSERVCIWLHSFDGGVKDIAILHHELFHWVHKSLAFIGIKYSDDSEEVFAYMTEYYTRELYKAFTKKGWIANTKPTDAKEY